MSFTVNVSPVPPEGELPPELTMSDIRRALTVMSQMKGDWQGIPVPIADLPVRLHPYHPLRDVFAELNGLQVEVVCGGPSHGDDDYEVEVNRWYSLKLNVEVRVYKAIVRGKRPRFFAVRIPHSQPMDRLGMWLRTTGAHQAWDLDAEYTARGKLYELLAEHQVRQYELTGTFLEHSPRSDLTYLFRKLRPTVVLTPRWPSIRRRPLVDDMRCLAVLCMHPVGYYDRTWAGCMVPTDDVVAHLLWMRADEAGYWSKANQHEPWRPEAGL